MRLKFKKIVKNEERRIGMGLIRNMNEGLGLGRIRNEGLGLIRNMNE